MNPKCSWNIDAKPMTASAYANDAVQWRSELKHTKTAQTTGKSKNTRQKWPNGKILYLKRLEWREPKLGADEKNLSPRGAQDTIELSHHPPPPQEKFRHASQKWTGQSERTNKRS